MNLTDEHLRRGRRRRPNRRRGHRHAARPPRATRRLVDRSRLGADTLSTHALMRGRRPAAPPLGAARPRPAAGTPPVHRTTFTYQDASCRSPSNPSNGVDALYAPRRTVLDPILVNAASEAGRRRPLRRHRHRAQPRRARPRRRRDRHATPTAARSLSRAGSSSAPTASARRSPAWSTPPSNTAASTPAPSPTATGPALTSTATNGSSAPTAPPG